MGSGFFKEFVKFVRDRGVMGLAVGFILGGSTQKVVTALVNDIISPLVGLLFPHAESLSEKKLSVGATQVLWGDFLKVSIDFCIMLLIVYYGVKLLHTTTRVRSRRKK
jgi:large conductance mechanosensitive channel